MRFFEARPLVAKALALAVAFAVTSAPLTAAAQSAAQAVQGITQGAPATAPAGRAANQATVPITGTATNGAPFTGTFHAQRFQRIGNRIFAVGVVNGTLGGQPVADQAVALPLILGSPQGPGQDPQELGALTPQDGVRSALATAGDQALIVPTQATCPILHLTLGPLDLNLLGLMVHLNQVVLNIDAQAGPGNLLGNLLCAVANLLNGPNLGILTNLLNQIVNLLNGILAGL